jgi:hypothetical protein
MAVLPLLCSVAALVFCDVDGKSTAVVIAIAIHRAMTKLLTKPVRAVFLIFNFSSGLFLFE